MAIYLNELRVTVEDVKTSFAEGISIEVGSGPFANAEPLWASPEQATDILRGLLRWKLETSGTSLREGDVDAFKKVLRALERETAPPRRGHTSPPPYRRAGSSHPLEVWEDSALPEDADIKAAHPTRTGRHDLYAEAMRLVGAKHSKRGLIDLVNWLLYVKAGKP